MGRNGKRGTRKTRRPRRRSRTPRRCDPPLTAQSERTEYRDQLPPVGRGPRGAGRSAGVTTVPSGRVTVPSALRVVVVGSPWRCGGGVRTVPSGRVMLSSELRAGGAPVWVINGSTPAAERQPITEKFQREGGALLLTHSGTEGVWRFDIFKRKVECQQSRTRNSILFSFQKSQTPSHSYE